MDLLPTSLAIEDDSLVIVWNDDSKQKIPVRVLRQKCPCATCRERRLGQEEKPASSLPVLSIEEAKPLAITSMVPVGNYAYSIEFNDGHSSGIFTFELLKSFQDA